MVESLENWKSQIVTSNYYLSACAIVVCNSIADTKGLALCLLQKGRASLALFQIRAIQQAMSAVFAHRSIGRAMPAQFVEMPFQTKTNPPSNLFAQSG